MLLVPYPKNYSERPGKHDGRAGDAVCEIVDSLNPQAYILEIAPGQITILGGDAAGVFYGR